MTPHTPGLRRRAASLSSNAAAVAAASWVLLLSAAARGAAATTCPSNTLVSLAVNQSACLAWNASGSAGVAPCAPGSTGQVLLKSPAAVGASTLFVLQTPGLLCLGGSAVARSCADVAAAGSFLLLLLLLLLLLAAPLWRTFSPMGTLCRSMRTWSTGFKGARGRDACQRGTVRWFMMAALLSTCSAVVWPQQSSPTIANGYCNQGAVWKTPSTYSSCTSLCTSTSGCVGIIFGASTLRPCYLINSTNLPCNWVADSQYNTYFPQQRSWPLVSSPSLAGQFCNASAQLQVGTGTFTYAACAAICDAYTSGCKGIYMQNAGNVNAPAACYLTNGECNSGSATWPSTTSNAAFNSYYALSSYAPAAAVTVISEGSSVRAQDARTWSVPGSPCFLSYQTDGNIWSFIIKCSRTVRTGSGT